jgi:hypothetical protein
VLAVIGALIHAQGALRTSPMSWNVIPNEIDRNLDRLLDWRDPQFLRTKPPAASGQPSTR